MDLKKSFELIAQENFLVIFSIILILASIISSVFIIFIYPTIANESFFATRAIDLNNGIMPYSINGFTHPPFAVYFLSIFSIFSELNTVTVHMAGYFWDVAILILIFLLTKKYFGLKSSVIASAIYAVFSIWLSIGAVYGSEYPSAFFGLLGITFYLFFLEKRNRTNLLISGIIIAISIWFKQPGVLYFLAICVHQLYLSITKKQNYRKLFINAIYLTLGILSVSIPLLIYFLYTVGWKFLYQIIIFNLLFKTRHSMILTVGKCLRMLLQYFGIFLIIILATPRREWNNLMDKTAVQVLGITSFVFIGFYFINKELFGNHLINLLIILIPLTFFYVKNYSEDSVKIIRILILIGLMTVFMFNIEAIAREYQQGDKLKEEQVKEYLIQEIPEGSSVFSIHDLYNFLTGFRTSYKHTTIQPNTESIKDMQDFCNYSIQVDYLILTKIQKKYLGKENLDCIYSKFTTIKTFEDIDPSGQGEVEILKRNDLLS